MLAPPSPPASPSPFLNLQPSSPRAEYWETDHEHPTTPPPGFAHYRSSPAFTFHAYSPPASPHADDVIAPPALSTKRASRLSAPFPTFLYASEPPPVTARNKQRVRPSAAQLADLKSLYAITAHPTREEREALGRRIGMRYQSVTNWFQNQRSTAKKRAATSPDGDRVARMPSPSPSSRREDDEHDTEEGSHEDFPAAEEDHRQVVHIEHEREPSPPPRPRHRTDPVRDIIIAQGGRHPSLSSLAQHQQQHAFPQHQRQRQHQQLQVLDIPPAPQPQQQQQHLPLPLSGSTIVPSSFPGGSQSANANTITVTLPPAPRTTPSHSRGASPPLVSSFQGTPTPGPELSASGNTVTSQTGSISERSHIAAGAGHRGKRSRPTPHQLAALRALHAQTSSPSIEERTRVGREIGMELGKVTNWFRNLRQTARKKERRALELGIPLDAEVVSSSRKRSRDSGDVGSDRKRARRQWLLDDDDDGMSVSTSQGSMHAFDGGSTFGSGSGSGSVDLEYEHEHRSMDVDDVHDYGHRRGDHENEDEHDYHGREHEHSYERHHHEYENEPEQEHDHDHDHERGSELGTESDAAHEAVTPEPQQPHTSPLTAPATPAPPSVSEKRAASVDDALLLLAFHGARA